MQLLPYLNFPGTCREAFGFYARTFGGTIEGIMTFGDSPMAAQMPPEMHGYVIHARMTVGSAVLLASDAPGDRYQKPQGFSVTLNADSIEQAEQIFAALADGGTVEMPIQETFWAPRFGMVTDRFGIPWMINFEKQA